MQVGFVVLHAVFALRVFGAELEAVGVGEDAAILQHPGDDLRHGQLLEDLLITVCTVFSNLRSQIQVQNRKEEGGKISSPEQFFLHD